MLCRSLVRILVSAGLAATASTLAAQQAIPLPPGIQAAPPANTTFSVPQQIRHADPPPTDWNAQDLEDRADQLRDQKFYADAMDYYEAAIKKGGNAAILHNKHGIAALQMLRYDLAKKDFEKALKSDRQYPEAYNNLGVVYYQRKNFKRAIREYENALKLRDTSASFHSNLGTAFFARKEYEKANEQYLRALEIDPDIFEHRNMGGISLQLISAEERAHYDYTVARIYARKGDAERSLIYLRKAMEEGYAKIDNVYKDNEFAALRKDPRFVELMAARPPAIPQ